mgnify:CR=1 FL=1
MVNGMKRQLQPQNVLVSTTSVNNASSAIAQLRIWGVEETCGQSLYAWVDDKNFQCGTIILKSPGGGVFSRETLEKEDAATRDLAFDIRITAKTQVVFGKEAG